MRNASMFELAIVFVGVLLLLSSLNIAYADATVQKSVNNQSLTVNYSTPSELTATDVIRYGNASVFNSSGDQLVNNTDYEYRPSNGTIEWFNSTATTENDTATVSFNYTTHQQAARTVATLLRPLGSAWGYLILLVTGGAVIFYGIDRGGF